MTIFYFISVLVVSWLIVVFFWWLVFWSFSLPYGLGITIRTMTLVSSIHQREWLRHFDLRNYDPCFIHQESGCNIFIQETKDYGGSFGQLIANVGTLCQLVGYSWNEGSRLWVITRVLIANQSAGILIFISYNLQKSPFQTVPLNWDDTWTHILWLVGHFQRIFWGRILPFLRPRKLGYFGILNFFLVLI